jgi:hypothetical protein
MKQKREEFHSVLAEQQGVLFAGQRRQSCYRSGRNDKHSRPERHE